MNSLKYLIIYHYIQGKETHYEIEVILLLALRLLRASIIILANRANIKCRPFLEKN